MSHFVLLVAGEDPESQLAAFREFECTGEVDKYVQSIDVTEKMRATFNESNVNLVVAPDGTEYGNHSDICYREPTEEEDKIVGKFGGAGYSDGLCYSSRDWGDGRGYRTKIHYVPDGFVKKEVPLKDRMAFVDWVADYTGTRIIGLSDLPDLHEKDKYGWVQIDEDKEVVAVISRTNPNAKWDYCMLGGQWKNYFKLQGVPTYVDQARKKDIDFDGMRREQGEEAAAKYDRVYSIAGKYMPAFKTWEEVKDMFSSKGIDAARTFYHKQEAILAINAACRANSSIEHIYDLDEFVCTKDEYVRRAEQLAGVPFAFIKDSMWYERGEMGWFGCVSDEKDNDLWYEEFNKFIGGLSDDTLLSIYDCHI